MTDLGLFYYLAKVQKTQEAQNGNKQKSSETKIRYKYCTLSVSAPK